MLFYLMNSRAIDKQPSIRFDNVIKRHGMKAKDKYRQQNINQLKFNIHNQQEINKHIYQQTSKKINYLILNTNNIQIFIFFQNFFFYIYHKLISY